MILFCFLISCSPESSKLLARPDLTKLNVTKTDDYFVLDPKLDILFVVDDSGSMAGHQANLSANIDRFVKVFFQRVTIDYHVGVISTTSDPDSSGPKCCGRLVGKPLFIDRDTPNGTKNLAGRLVLGTGGSGREKMFDPVVEALTEPNISTINQGFLRPDAHLAIIFITDAEDQSQNTSVSEFYDLLMKIKGKREKILAYGAIIPSGQSQSGCGRDEMDTPPQLIEQFLALTVNKGKNIFNLCAADFGDNLAQVAEDLAAQVSNTIYLNRAPIPNTIKVKFGTQEILNDTETGWTFDANLNAIYLGNKLALDPNQALGTKIRVDFKATNYLD